MSENGHRLVDVGESPMDLSQSAANFRTLPNTAVGDVSQGCQLSVQPAASGCGDSIACPTNPVSASAPRDPSMLPMVWAGNVDGRLSGVTSLPLSSTFKVFPVPYGGASCDSVSADIQHSTAASLMNFHSAVKSNSSAHSLDSFSERNSTGNSDSESDRTLQYPKTKKQKAVDGKATNLMLAPTVDGKVSEYGALTFGEIQERLITKVVESGSLAGVLRDDRQHVMSPNKPHVLGNLPPGQYSQCEASPNRPFLAQEMTPAERCNLQKVSSLPMTSSSLFSTNQKLVTSYSQGLSLCDLFVVSEFL